MSEIGVVHLVFSFVAIGAGAWVLLIPKGTRWHRTLGHVYAMSMVGIVATAFSLYDLTGSFGPFHVAAIIGGATLFGGLYSVLARRPKKQWIEAHAIWMSWSYIGLMAAFAAETLTRWIMPRVAPLFEGQSVWVAFWTSVGVASVAVFVIGSRLVKTLLPGAVAATPAAIRRERKRLEEAEGDGRVEGSSAA